jgi:hypothetical protein
MSSRFSIEMSLALEAATAQGLIQQMAAASCSQTEATKMKPREFKMGPTIKLLTLTPPERRANRAPLFSCLEKIQQGGAFL